jgi:hypothetical protein
MPPEPRIAFTNLSSHLADYSKQPMVPVNPATSGTRNAVSALLWIIDDLQAGETQAR